MTPTLDAYLLLQIAYWVAVLAAAVYILYLVSGFVTGEPPTSAPRAVLIVLGVAAAVYFTYDAAGYLFVWMAQDPQMGFQFPHGFTYWDWFREPFAVKWHVLGFLPFIRYLPIIIALTTGGILFVLIWAVPWREAAVVFMAQLFLTAFAMFVLSAAFGVAVRYFDPEAGEVAGAGRVQEPPGQSAPPQSFDHLHQRVCDLPSDQGTVWRRLDAGWQSVNGHLAPLYTVLRPVTRHLPPPAQDFLENGGWLLVFAGLVLLGLLWPRIRRQHHKHRRKHHAGHHASTARVKLSLVGDALTDLGPRQATVRGVPARLRFVVLTPVDPATGTVSKDASNGVLEAVRPGLGEVAGYDFPRVEVWPHLQPHGSFRQAIEADVEVPELPGKPSRWVLVLGTASLGERSVHVGLAFYVNETTTDRLIEVPPATWAEVLGLRTVPAEERE